VFTVSTTVVDVGGRIVRRAGREISLPPKAFDLLVILVHNRPNAVSHAQLHAALWPGVHVSETSLAALVTQLRKALDDPTDDRPLIRTLHRVGYAFVADAVVAGESPRDARPIARILWRGASHGVPATGDAIIGRDRDAAIHIEADSVSRHHARLHVAGRDVLIEDLGSKNGTWIAGERIRDAMPLTDGMSFRVGSETLRFERAPDSHTTRTMTAAGPAEE
jgi:DNA-binding winged helix-turn-helix (wHTH) protein